MTPPNNILSAYASGTTNSTPGNLFNNTIVGIAGSGYRYRLFGVEFRFSNTANAAGLLWGWIGDGTTNNSVFMGQCTYQQSAQGLFLPQGLPMPNGGAIILRCRCSHASQPIEILVNYMFERTA